MPTVSGLRYAKNNPPLRATLIRAVGFFLFASAYWALLPLVARTQIGGGAELYGLLLGGIGVGALVGAYLLPWLGHRLGADRLVAAGTLGTALSLLLYGLAREPFAALGASLLAGLSWICVLSTLNVSVQVALPEWVRARGLAVFVVFFFGALTHRQRALGLLGRCDRPVRHQFRGGRRYPCDLAAHLALEIAHCARRRPRSIYALAGTDRRS